MGTGNFDEDGYIMYFCKAGDGVVDLSLISDLHKHEVFKVGYALNLPKEILDSVPSADLWANQTDEDEMGFSYQFVELFTEYLMMNEQDQKAMMEKIEKSPEDLAKWKEWSEKAMRIHKRNSHKKYLPMELPIYPEMSKILKL